MDKTSNKHTNMTTKQAMEVLKDQKDWINNTGIYADTTFFINPSFLSAIVGLTDDDRLVYDYDKMIAAAIEENPDWTEEDAIEWIDFNTLRTVPYMGNKAPIIVFPLPL